MESDSYNKRVHISVNKNNILVKLHVHHLPFALATGSLHFLWLIRLQMAVMEEKTSQSTDGDNGD